MAAKQQVQLIQLADGKICSWHFFGLETYLALMQILYQDSTESVPQTDLHMTEQHCGPVPCSYVLAGSEGKRGPVQGSEDSARRGVVFEL